MHIGPHIGATDQWLVDVPTVRWLLARVAAGDIGPIEATDILRQVAKWNTGCCYWCDLAAPSYPEALRRYQEMRAAWQREQDQMTAVTHPYLLDNGLVHTTDCTRCQPPREPGHPGCDLHAYTAWHSALQGDLDQIMAALREEARTTRRISTEELLQWLRQRNPAAADPRCPACAPRMPDEWNSD
ncbi:hypothetical protein FKR81_00050 [Lentzea tibetensis]|uniref:Uncharacterized protein n=1 Tax=Lentzea tibetensis TaxID=2591470 RepID=A0A563F212_9PSEU|nr:hypothetical protein FKR81_00050 [Lentzea tibetensis]